MQLFKAKIKKESLCCSTQDLNKLVYIYALELIYQYYTCLYINLNLETMRRLLFAYRGLQFWSFKIAIETWVLLKVVNFDQTRTNICYRLGVCDQFQGVYNFGSD